MKRKNKFEHRIELERAGEGEYVLRLRIPQIKISPDPTGVTSSRQIEKFSLRCEVLLIKR